MYVPIETFQAYTNVYSDNTELQECYITAAEEVVQNYLGYSPVKKSYRMDFLGDGTNDVTLKAKPVRLTKIAINGFSVAPEEFTVTNEYIYFKQEVFPDGDRITIEYEAGYDKIPEIIEITVLRIAALLMTESDGNIGITGKQFAESGSRTFTNFTNFDKYLLPLSHYKLTKI